jgi:aspartate racemase
VLAAGGAEAVVVAGTDIFLAFEGHGCVFPVSDSAQAHSNALYRESVRRAR